MNRRFRFGCIAWIVVAHASWGVEACPTPADAERSDGTSVAAEVRDQADGTGSCSQQPAAGAQFAIPTTYDRAGRILAAVRIGEQGPYRFILDTGANRSALSERVLRSQELPVKGQYRVHGITGTAVAPVVKIKELRIGELRFADQELAVLPEAVFAGTDGILGIDLLQRARIEVDFTSDTVTILRGGHKAPADHLVVRARLRRGGLMLVPGQVGNVRVNVILDTGAERTLGNQRLRDALGGRGYILPGTVTKVVGATGQVAEGYSFAVPPVALGGGTFVDNLTVTFGDFHVFKVWSLLEQPALLIGMDALGNLPQFIIDYPKRQFLLHSAPAERRRPDRGDG